MRTDIVPTHRQVRGRLRLRARPATSRPRSRSSSAASAAGEKDVVLLGATGTGKSATDGLADRAAAAPDAGHGAEQDPGRPAGQRAARDAAEQRRRVLRQLLRLLPARGLRPADRHLHREGLLGQRRGRAAAALGHHVAAHPARRRRGRHRVLHLRPGHPAGVRRPLGAAAGRPADRARDDPAPARRRAVHPQRPVLHPRHVPGPRRHRRDLPGVRGARDPGRDVRRRDRAALLPAPAHRRGRPRGRGGLRLPGHALRRRARADGTRDPRHRGRARGAAGRARGAEQAARGAAAAHAHQLRHRDDAPGRVLLGHRELLAAHRRPRAAAARRTACSTTSPRTSCSSSTSRT